MDAEILAIGSELLLGTTIDTNSAHIAQQLTAHGVTVVRKSMVGDRRDHIAAAVNEALTRADLVICTGGLGPTEDDLTREGVAQAFGQPLVFRAELLEQIAARFASFKRPMSESNRRQAYIPASARAIENPRGTAPAFRVADERGTVIVLPGVPSEMRYLLDAAVLPYLRDERGITDVALVRVLHATGAGESVIGEQIADLMQAENPAVGISAKRARYELRIVARAASAEAAEALMAPVVTTIQDRLGDRLLGSEHLDEQVGRLLTEQGLSLALYEGHIAAPLYQAVRGGRIAQEHVRGVLIHAVDTPADEEAACALARAGAANVRERWRSDLGLGLSVVAPTTTNATRTVCLTLISEAGLLRATHTHDLNLADNWDVIGTLGLGLLRRFLLRDGTAQTS